jgi:3-dehydroquinate synthase
MPPGEEQKSLPVLQSVCEQMVEAGLDRRSLLVALGGGVIGDLGGFAAASYMRGIPYVQVPTTLLAQVDSSVGGKTAVNLPQGKNLVGAFYQPAGVLIDVELLRTLSERDVRAGMVEVVKYGVIRDAGFFRWLEDHLDDCLALEPDAVLNAVRRSCEIKAEVVGADEREGGLRAILNYGHTAGHAIEALTSYGALRHGEAVAIGMEVAAVLSGTEIGFTEQDCCRQTEVLQRLQVPTRMEGLAVEAVLAEMARDKKTVAGRVRFVLARRIGEVEPGREPGSAAVRQALVQCGAQP